MDLSKFLIGENFKDLSTISINFTNHQQKRNYSRNNIVFCKTDLVLMFFNEVRNLDINIILITHQSDYEVNNMNPLIDGSGNLFIDWARPAEGNTPALYKIKPPQIKKWFAQNVNHKSDNLIPLPIGLENHHGPSRGGSIDPNYLEGLEDIKTDNICKEGKITDKIYLNFDKTHNNRENVRNFLIESKLCFIESEKLSYPNYLKKMSEFLFIASPRGNGIDTHRTWEALYMGSIPIVEKHHMYDTYNLPIWQIESWDEVTNESKRNYWIERYNSGNLFQNIDQLFMEYWKNRILDEYNKL